MFGFFGILDAPSSSLESRLGISTNRYTRIVFPEGVHFPSPLSPIPKFVTLLHFHLLHSILTVTGMDRLHAQQAFFQSHSGERFSKPRVSQGEAFLSIASKLLEIMVARDGIEPPTPAFSGPRSTTELPGLSADL
jgi:hypothetical protein